MILEYKKVKPSDKGFSLIELMLSLTILAIVIIGILLLQGRLTQSKLTLSRIDEAKNIAVKGLEDILVQYPYGSITTQAISPFFSQNMTINGVPYHRECLVTDLDDVFDNLSTDGGRNGGTDTAIPADDYKEIRVVVTYPKTGINLGSPTIGQGVNLGSQTLSRLLYNNRITTYGPK